MTSVQKALLGRKLGMMQIFDENSHALAVTVIAVGPCQVVQRKRVEKEGYDALQLGYEEATAKRLNKPRLGHIRKAGEKAGIEIPPYRHLAEVRFADCEAFAVGAQMKAEIFEVGERVDVTATSKGKGFAGAQKRHHFSGGPGSHGSMSHRRPASGGATEAARTFPGVKKPGHMGSARVTVKGLRIEMVDAEKGVLAVRGAVPGPTGALVLVTQRAPSRKSKKEGE